MEIGETLYVTDRRDLRRWLQKNHSSKAEVWLIRYKKSSGKPSLDYVEAVEEALCYGWIDSLEKSMDSERYVLRFTPRRPRSHWNAINLERARRLIETGKMTRAGLGALPDGFASARGAPKRVQPSRPGRASRRA